MYGSALYKGVVASALSGNNRACTFCNKQSLHTCMYFLVCIMYLVFCIFHKLCILCTGVWAPASGSRSAHFVISSNGPAPSETHMVDDEDEDEDDDDDDDHIHENDDDQWSFCI